VSGVAIVGMACRYADARSPRELWENVLAQRRAFRRMPAVRLRCEDYPDDGTGDPDSFYVREVAVLADYEFDRVAYRVAGSTYRSADPVHWLALEVADQALADAGFPQGEGLARQATGVLVGNSLTGELSRANLLRLRWPYVERVVAAALAEEGWEDAPRAAFLGRLETAYKRPFAEMTEESLAGGLSNTIAGRICNHFDLGGGGFTVDGACASSLLAVAQACSQLAAGDVEVALAGGVDLSLDPFELVGFARTGALAAGDMRVFDARPSGFLPGEGCGFVVLMREEEAAARGLRVYGVIRGWGISSDGSGGISRPEVAGQQLAIRRAYARAGFPIDSVGYFEGHGTGTSVGDETELKALIGSFRSAAAAPGIRPPAPLGSIKANIGHTKAAAGVAGLIKATLALRHQVLPPTTGCEDPHPELRRHPHLLRVLREPEIWPSAVPLRAAVSAMGFGGINSHVVVAAEAARRRRRLSPVERHLGGSAQDAELFLLSAAGDEALRRRLEPLLALVPHLSRAELGDLAGELARRLDGGRVRAAVVATRPSELAPRLATLLGWLAAEPVPLRVAPGIMLGRAAPPARVGFLFPGQGAPLHAGRGALARRFDEVAELYERIPGAAGRTRETGEGGKGHEGGKGDAGHAAGADTAWAQPTIVGHSLAGLAALELLGVSAAVGLGHSLGELTALYWAEAWDEESLLRVAAWRGSAMAELGHRGGAMAAIGAEPETVAALLDPTAGQIGIAAFNSPRSTVVSGEVAAVERAVERAKARGLDATRLRVSHAFHSPLVAPAVPRLAEGLAGVPLRLLTRRVVSTVTGGQLAPATDLRALLLSQVTAPVRFTAALAAAADVELWIEVGPGRALSDLVAGARPPGAVPAVALDAGGPSLHGLLEAAGAAFCAGLPVRLEPLFAGRLSRPLRLDAPPVFLANPCELAPLPAGVAGVAGAAGEAAAGSAVSPGAVLPAQGWAMASAGVVPLSGSPADGRPGNGHGAPPARAGAAAANEPRGTPPVQAEAAATFTAWGAQQLQAEAIATFAPRGTPPAQADAAAATEPRRAPPVLEVVRQLVAARTELPAAAVGEHSRLLRDLHLNSLSVGQLAVEAARQLGLDPPAAPGDFATATVGEMAQALAEQARRQGTRGERREHHPAGVDGWVRAFAVELRERPLAARAAGGASGPAIGPRDGWRFVAPGLGEDHPLAPRLALALAGEVPGGLLICLPATGDERHIALLLAAAAAALAEPVPERLVVVAPEGAGGFARTLHLELPRAAERTTCLIDVPPEHPRAVEWVLAEIAAAVPGFQEARYDDAGRRYVPVLRALSPLPPLQPSFTPPSRSADDGGGALALGPADVLLVTGGGKGIGAECALGIARHTGARVGLVGRSLPADDTELAANLERFAAAGIRWLYCAADVTHEPALREAVHRCERELGPITGVLHAAGINHPRLLGELDAGAFHRTVAPKLAGLRHLLSALDPSRLRLLLTFGSAIARTGMAGEADYATANEWLRLATERFAAAHPVCRCLALEWSVWAGLGMGERLGRIQALVEQGIAPIPPDSGVRLLLELLAHPPAGASVLLSGRMGASPTLSLERPELPLRRFLERPRVYYPGIELIADADLAAHTDPYLDDHVFGGHRLLPAVLGLEAMAQAAMVLAGREEPPTFEQVELSRPVVVEGTEPAVIRVAALLRGPDEVEVALRAAESAFQVDHFRARCIFGSAVSPPLPHAAPALVPAGAHEQEAAHEWQGERDGGARDGGARDGGERDGGERERGEGAGMQERAREPERTGGGESDEEREEERVLLRPAPDLYGHLLFHTGRFRRIAGYRMVRAGGCVAEIGVGGGSPWYAAYLPAEMVLGDAAARDAAIHGLQPCVPHLSVLPIGVERLACGRLRGDQTYQLAARERSRSGDTFVFDLEILDREGRAVERWEGLRLRGVAPIAPPERWPLALLGPWVERRFQELLPGGAVSVLLERRAGPRRRGAAEFAARRLLGPGLRVRRRPDDKPEVAGERQISASHARGLILAVAAAGAVGCDVELVAPRDPAIWRELLGEERFALAELLARQAGGGLDRHATLVWAAGECLKKAGAVHGAPLSLATSCADGWQLLRSGHLFIGAVVAAVREIDATIALAVLASPPAAAAVAEPASLAVSGLAQR
jgi:enediyne polyketide synthase